MRGVISPQKLPVIAEKETPVISGFRKPWMRPHHCRGGRHRPRPLSIGIASAAVVLLLAVAVLVVGNYGGVFRAMLTSGVASSSSADGSSSSSSDDIVKRLIAEQTNNTCAVAFSGDGIDVQPVAETKGALFANLPTPERAGYIFAGWYSTPDAAASLTETARVNGSQVVSCTYKTETLYGAWVTSARTQQENTHVPILMYHQFTTKPGGESGALRLNYTYIADFENQISYISAQHYYLPTWTELNSFIDGKLFLPRKSVIVTDDDADITWLQLAVPVVTKHKVLTTSFVITVWRTAPTPSTYVLQRSHTQNMHRAGANGKGLMINASLADIVADLKTSISVLGVSEVLAYPFGNYNPTAEEALRETGFSLAVTTQDGTVSPGATKLELPRKRIDYGMSFAAFAATLPS